VGVASELEPRHRSQPLYTDRLVGVARRGRFGPEGPSLEAFCAAEHVLVAPRNGTGGTIDRALAARGLQRRVLLTVPQFIFAPYMVAKVDLVACLPARIALAKAELLDLEIFAPPVELPEFTVSLLWHGRDDEDPAHRFLRETIAAVAERVTALDGDPLHDMCRPRSGESGLACFEQMRGRASDAASVPGPVASQEDEIRTDERVPAE
jgi:DNA-binding transcriptional LysR family regulator